MKLLVVIAILVVCLVGWMHATVSLADSGYPMPGANPQRNYKANRPIRCASVSNGKTTVLNVIHTFPSSTANFLPYTTSKEVTLDDKGWAYVTASNAPGNTIQRFNTVDGSYNEASYYSTGLDDPKLTQLAGGVMYFSGEYTTHVVNTTFFTTILNFTDPANFGYVTSMAPFKNDWLVKSKNQADLNGTEAIMYFKDSTANVDTSFNNIKADFTGTATRDVLIYKSTTTSTEFPIVAGYATSTGGSTIIASPTYTVTLPNAYTKNVMIVGDEIIVSHYDYLNGAGLYKLNAATGAITLNQTYATWNGNAFSLYSPLIYHNGKSFAHALMSGQVQFIDLVSGQTLASSTTFRGVDRNFAFSNDDQTVLSLGISLKSKYFEIMGFEWDTWKVNVRSRIPYPYTADVSYVSDPQAIMKILTQSQGTVVIGDNCRVHVGINRVFYTLAPLPVQNVVPILECVDRTTRIGYFTYNNTGSTAFSMPQVNDRNNLSPLNVAPVEVYSTGLGPNFPFSSQVLLNVTDTYTWVLEDYVLTFTITPDLYCPESIAFGIILTANGTFPVGFDQVVRDVFVNVTGISGSRVTIVTGKRSVQQQGSQLETDLNVDPDPTNTEPTPAQVVQQFTESQQTEFTQQVQNQEGAPDNIQTSLSGKQQPNAIPGQIPPQPVAPPASSTPPTTAPLSNPTSIAHTLKVLSSLSIVVTFLAVF